MQWNAMTTTRLDRLFPYRPLLLLGAAAVVLTGCAHSIPPPDATPARQAAAMTATTSSPVAGDPALAAEEIGKRFLKLIKGLESRSDLSVQQVQDVLGIRLQRFEDAPDYLLAYSQPLGDGWYAAIRHIAESPSLLQGIVLDFGRPGERFAPVPGAICVLDFDDYHNALTAMGFRAVEIRGEIGQLESWRYYKGDITLSIQPQNLVPGEAGRLCVKSIGTLN